MNRLERHLANIHPYARRGRWRKEHRRGVFSAFVDVRIQCRRCGRLRLNAVHKVHERACRLPSIYQGRRAFDEALKALYPLYLDYYTQGVIL